MKPTLEDDVHAWTQIDGAKAKIGRLLSPLTLDPTTERHVKDAVNSLIAAQRAINERRANTKGI